MLAAETEGQPARIYMLLIRGDHALNEIKVTKIPGLEKFRWATEAEIVAVTGCNPGYLGPVGIPKDLTLIADRTVAVMADFICGANERDFHLRGVNFGRDCREPERVADLRNVVAGDPSPDGRGPLEILRGIEVGHVFALGDVYSRAMSATYLDAGGQSRVLEMGCYGIGITRVVAAAIEQNHDGKGIAWPQPLAPFRGGDRPGGLRPQRRGPGGRRRAARRARGCRGRSAARRSRRAPWRDVCRSRADRHSASDNDRRIGA